MTAGRTLDPELAALATLIPRIDITTPHQAREVERTLINELRRDADLAVEYEVVRVERPDGTSLNLGIHRPSGSAHVSDLPVLVFVHGGSFVLGGLHTEEERCARYSVAADCAVVSVDYRLAPEHRYPAAVDDVAQALSWVVTEASELGFDHARVAIGGLSAGGAIAAGTALWWRDVRTGSRLLPSGAPIPGVPDQIPELAMLMLLHPALDASTSTRSSRSMQDTPVLDAAHLPVMWRMYLGYDPEQTPPPALASPLLADDFESLPPTNIVTSEFDPFRDEALAFAGKLLDADVSVDLRLHARAFHSFDSFSATRMGRSALGAQADSLQVAFR